MIAEDDIWRAVERLGKAWPDNTEDFASAILRYFRAGEQVVNAWQEKTRWIRAGGRSSGLTPPDARPVLRAVTPGAIRLLCYLEFPAAAGADATTWGSIRSAGPAGYAPFKTLFEARSLAQAQDRGRTGPEHPR